MQLRTNISFKSYCIWAELVLMVMIAFNLIQNIPEFVAFGNPLQSLR